MILSAGAVIGLVNIQFGDRLWMPAVPSYDHGRVRLVECALLGLVRVQKIADLLIGSSLMFFEQRSSHPTSSGPLGCQLLVWTYNDGAKGPRSPSASSCVVW